VSDNAAEVARAHALLQVNRPEAAASELRKAIASDPSDPKAWCVLAAAQLRMNQPAAALESAREASKADPELEWPHRIMSVARGQLDHSIGAVSSAREAVRLAPDTALTHAQLAIALSRGGFRERRQVHGEIRRAVALAPEDASIHFFAGNALMRRRRTGPAMAHFRRALQIDPEHSDAMNNLAVLQLRRGRLLSAASGFGSAAAADPRKDISRRNLDVAFGRFVQVVSLSTAALAIAVGIARLPGALGCAVIAGIAVSGWHARRRMGAATFSYLLRVPRRRLRIALVCCFVVGCLLYLTLAGLVMNSEPVARGLILPLLIVGANGYRLVVRR
jgi:Flp pilus assembly protein TadD